MRSWAILLLAVICTAAYGLARAEEPPQLVIGAILPLTGPAAAFGLSAKQGFEMGLARHQGRRIKVIYEDNQLSSAKTVAAFRKLVEVDKVPAIFTLSASASNSIAPLAEQTGTLLLAASSDRMVSKDRPFVIRTWCSGFEEGQALADAILADTRTHVALLWASSDYHASLREGLVSRLGKSIVQDDEIRPDEMDFSAPLLRMKTQKAEAIIALLGPGQLARFALQVRALHLGMPLYGAIQFEDPHENVLAQGALSGAHYVTAWNTPQFTAELQESRRDAPVVSLAAAHYEVARLLAEYRGEPTAQALRQFLLSSGVRDGALGRFSIRSDSFGAFLSVPVTVRQVQ